MITKLNGREKVQAHLIANKVNELIEIITRLKLEVEALKNGRVQKPRVQKKS